MVLMLGMIWYYGLFNRKPKKYISVHEDTCHYTTVNSKDYFLYLFYSDCLKIFYFKLFYFFVEKHINNSLYVTAMMGGRIK